MVTSLLVGSMSGLSATTALRLRPALLSLSLSLSPSPSPSPSPSLHHGRAAHGSYRLIVVFSVPGFVVASTSMADGWGQ